MNIEKYLQRISWRFSSGKSFKPNDNDIEALNNIIKWVNNQRGEAIRNNELFAKLYIYVFEKFVQHYETNVFDSIPQIELSRLLSDDLENFYHSFTQSLNDNHRQSILMEKGIELKIPILKNEADQNKEAEILKGFTPDDLENLRSDPWNVEEVSAKLITMITEALNKFS